MAGIPMKKKLNWVKVLTQFSGNASLAQEIANGGADPYAKIAAGK